MNQEAKHPSDSHVQQHVERQLLSALSQELECSLEPHKIRLNKKSTIQIDGFSAEGRILCEVYAHVGLLRGGQPDKAAADILKLNLAAGRMGGKWRKILLFADDAACRLLKGSSWLAEACRESQIVIHVAKTNAETREGIVTAQRRQKMVNAE